MLGSLEAIRLKCFQIIQLSSLLAFQPSSDERCAAGYLLDPETLNRTVFSKLLAGLRYGSDGSADVFDAFFLAEDVGLSAALVSFFFFGAAALLGLDLLA